MGRVTEIAWDDGHGLVELQLWGTGACLTLVDTITDLIADLENSNQAPLAKIVSLSYMVDEKLREMDQKLQDFIDAMDAKDALEQQPL